MVFLVGGANSATGYEIENSVRFNVGDSPHLEITPSSTGDEQKWTFSTWVKRCDISSSNDLVLIGATTDSDNGCGIVLRGSGDDFKLQSYCAISGTANNGYNFETNARFRDPSAWYHIVVATDTTQSTNTNGIKFYVNGSQITSFGATTYNQNINTQYNTSSSKMQVGARASDDAQELDGYLADTYWVDGSQLTASDFGETNDNGVWIPKIASPTFGTNGFKLEYKQTGTSANSSGIGADTSGNDNHLTPTNLAAADITTDTPTNNFATFNPLTLKNNPGAYYITFSEGNLKIAGNSATNNGNGHSTMGFNSGKWYCEMKIIDVQGDVYPTPGVIPENLINNGTSNSGQIGYSSTDTVGYGSDGDKVINDSGTSYGDTYTDNDIIGIAIDCDNGAVYFSKNGTFQNSGDPTSGSSKTNAAMTFTPSKYYFFGCSVYNTTSIVEANFGNPPFSISSGNADANGYGNFEYAVPSGYYALCTKNLAEFG